jgi:hypothetical protein
MGDGAIPTLAQIQRVNAVLLAAAGLLLLLLVSPAASLSCLVGGGFVIANLFVLGWLGRLMLAAAAGGGGPALAVIAMPLKLLLVGGLIYLVFARIEIDALGFGVGVSTQLVAIIVETCRASIRRRRCRSDLEEADS